MGIWYLLILVIGILLLIKSILSYKKKEKSITTFIISIVLILFSIFMFSQLSIKLIDSIF